MSSVDAYPVPIGGESAIRTEFRGQNGRRRRVLQANVRAGGTLVAPLQRMSNPLMACALAALALACNRNEPSVTDEANQHGGPTHPDTATASPQTGINAAAQPVASTGLATVDTAAAGTGGMGGTSPLAGSGPSGGTAPTPAGGTRHGNGGTGIR